MIRAKFQVTRVAELGDYNGGRKEVSRLKHRDPA
jgi:hypothetical protein